MTKTNQKDIEYAYQSSQSGHHHNYLLPPLLELISKEDNKLQSS